MENSVCQQIRGKAYTKIENQENKYFSSLCVDAYLNLNPYIHETEIKQPEFILFGLTSRKHTSNCRKPRRATLDHMQNSHTVICTSIINVVIPWPHYKVEQHRQKFQKLPCLSISAPFSSLPS